MEAGVPLPANSLKNTSACWLAAVTTLYVFLAWLVSTPLMPRYFLGAVAILLVPLGRLSAAPLALAWNRHR